MFGAVLTLAFGLLTGWMAYVMHRAIRATKHWLTVTGKVLTRDLGRMSTGGRGAYYPILKYSYEVDGKSYTNDTVYIIGRSGRALAPMRKFLDELPESIPVHYDPKDPARSYLLRNSRFISFLVITAAVITTFVGLVRVLSLLS